MALSKDVLGAALYDRFNDFNNQDINNIGPIEDARLAFCKALADEVIKHFTTDGVVHVTVATTGTASSHTGSGTGTIS